MPGTKSCRRLWTVIFAGQDVNCIINDKSILITKVPSQPSSEDSPAGMESVTGQVKGPNGLPLVGVTVLIDGTMVGTTDRCLRKFPDQGEVRGYAGLLVYRLPTSAGKR